MPGTSAGRVCGRLAATVLALTLGGPAFVTAADTTSSGVVVFGSYLNAQTAESQRFSSTARSSTASYPSLCTRRQPES